MTVLYQMRRLTQDRKAKETSPPGPKQLWWEND